MSRSFSILATGINSNDGAVRRYIGEQPCVFYKLSYTPPYKEFLGIRQFQLEGRYRPFEDRTQEFKYAAIDLSEWEGHETEEYLELFMKFVHDYTDYFDFKYIFVTGCTEQKHIKSIFQLANRYLEDGEVLLDRTFVDEKALASYISKRYHVNKMASSHLASGFINGGMSGYAELEMVMQDIVSRAKEKKEINVEDIQLVLNTKSSKLHSLYREAMQLQEEESREV